MLMMDYLSRMGKHSCPLMIKLDKNEVTIGVENFPEMRQSAHVSRQHASFRITSDGEWFVTDLQSLYGVYVNGTRIKQALYRLKLGDSIGLGVIHATSNEDFEFSLCRVKEEPDDDYDVIFQNDIETSDTGICNISQGFCRQESGLISNLSVNNIQLEKETEDLNSYRHRYSHIINGPQPIVVLTRCDELLHCPKNTSSIEGTRKRRKQNTALARKSFSRKRRKLIVDERTSCQIENDVINNLEVNDFQSKEEIEDLNSYKHRYSHIINGPQPIVVLTRCDEMLRCPKNTSLTKGSLKRTKQNATLHHKKKKIEYRIDNKNALRNVFPSNEDSNFIFKSRHSTEEQESDITINTAVYNEFLNMNSGGCFLCSSNSNDILLPSRLVKSTKIPFSKVHLVDRDNELDNFKTQINARPASSGEETNDSGNFSCEGSNSATEQPFVLHRIKIENGLHNSEPTNFEIPPVSSIAVKIKTEIPEVDDRVNTNMEEERAEDEVFGYSQTDEVITISDDDDYLNFRPSQEKNGESMLNIKVEPTDYDDTDFENYIEERMEELAKNCNKDSHSNYKGLESDADSEDEQYSENIDAIKHFLQRNNTSRENARKPTTNNAIQSKIKEKNANKVEKDNALSPVLSKKIYPQEKLSTDKSQQNLPACENGKLETSYSRIPRKKHATTRLIEPQPMKNHQRRSAEWFNDIYYGKKDKGCDEKRVKQSNKTSKNVKETQVELKSQMNSKHSVKKKKSIKDKVEEQMSHRICVRNGSSEVRSATAESKISSNKTKSVRPVHIPMEKQTSVPSNEVSTNSGVKKDKITRENISEINDSLKSPTEFQTKNPTQTKPISKSPSNSGKTYKIPKLKSNSKDASLLTNTEMIQVPKIGEIKNGLNSVEKQNFPQASITETKVIRQAEIYESDKPSNSELLFLNIAHDTMGFRRIGLANAQGTITNGTDILTTYNPATGRELVPNYNAQLRDPRIRNIPPPAQQFCVVKPMNIQNESLPADAKEVVKKFIRLDFDSVLSVVLHWSPVWLKEYKYIGKPPPCITQDLKYLPSSYKSLNEYIASFYPVILLELWEYVLKEYDQMERAAKDKHEVNAIGMIITECISKGDIMVLNCESIVSSNSEFYPREGNLVIVDLKEANNKQSIRKIFGYVFNHRIEKLDSCHLHREFHRRPEAKSSNSLLYKFSLKTKRLKFQPALEKLTKACVLCYVANKVRLAEGLQYLLTSPLKDDILHPSEKTVKCQHRNAELPKAVLGHYNQTQTSAIVDIAEEIMGEYFKHKLILLQGPPGTGKTHTITGLIQYLIANENVKIFITAPSNAAVDEIGKRLIELRKSHNLKNMKVVRIGQHERIHKDLLPYALENLTMNNISKNIKYKLEHTKKQLKEADEVIQLLKREISCKSRTESLAMEVGEMKNKLRIHIQRKQTLIEEIERKGSVAFNNPEIYANKITVLEKANVILSTLGSCRLKILEKVFGEKSGAHFTCCIVDEATQCTEPELMQLLAFGLSKFVLIGDHQQLPATVYSKLAAQLNYNVSFFQRILTHFQKQHLPSPIRMLTEQYRMHSEICSFPSLHFYSNKLYTPAGLDEQLNFPLKPFVILNVNESRESNALCSKKNSPEAEIIFRTCEELRRKLNFDKYSIGIITPYQGQKDLILSSFKGNFNYNQMEVNTIDSFQGREKDIIILSCVRARSHDGNIGFLECSQRLNVALTRARHCLIICGHMNSLNNQPDWRALINHSKQRDAYINVSSVEDIPVVIERMKRKI